jgi:predicted nucleic acid-binding protein
MRAGAFVDTNILLSAISTDPEEAAKKQRARDILAQPDWGLSIQVLQEFYVNATRPPQPAMRHEDAEAAIRQLLLHPTVDTHAALLLDALRLKARYQLSCWDAAIVAAAMQIGAATLYSEDLQDGQEFEGVKIVNPFLSA